MIGQGLMLHFTIGLAVEAKVENIEKEASTAPILEYK